LADVVALAAFGVDPGVVEIAAQVGVADGGVGEQVPDDDQQGAADGDDGFLAAAAAGDAPVPLSQEGVGPGDGGGRSEGWGEFLRACPGYWLYPRRHAEVATSRAKHNPHWPGGITGPSGHGQR
jgi:hypothetical protein